MQVQYVRTSVHSITYQANKYLIVNDVISFNQRKRKDLRHKHTETFSKTRFSSCISKKIRAQCHNLRTRPCAVTVIINFICFSTRRFNMSANCHSVGGVNSNSKYVKTPTWAYKNAHTLGHSKSKKAVLWHRQEFIQRYVLEGRSWWRRRQ